MTFETYCVWVTQEICICVCKYAITCTGNIDNCYLTDNTRLKYIMSNYQSQFDNDI